MLWNAIKAQREAIARVLAFLLEVGGVAVWVWLALIDPKAGPLGIAIFGLVGLARGVAFGDAVRMSDRWRSLALDLNRIAQNGVRLLDDRGTIADEVARHVAARYPAGACPISTVHVEIRNEGNNLVMTGTAEVQT